MLIMRSRIKCEYPQGWVARMVGDGGWFGWWRLAAFEKSLMNLPVVQEAVPMLLRILRYARAAGKLACRWFDIRLKEREGWRKRERETASRKERWKKRLKTATKTETSLTSRCERSVETEEGVKRWWRRQLKGDGDGGVEGLKRDG